MTMTVLHIRSGATGDASVSNMLGDAVVARWRARGARVVVRDLDAQPVPHVTSAGIAAFGRGEVNGEAARATRALSDLLIAELRMAELIVLGVPMYNFGIPSTLKAWFDHVMRAGETFEYRADGPYGLLSGRRVILCSARGGFYQAEGAASDFQEPHVRTILAFMGLTDVEMVRAEGLARGDEARATGLAAGEAAIATLT